MQYKCGVYKKMTTEESGTNGTGKGKPNKSHDKDKWFGEEEMKGSYFSYGTPGQTDIHTKTLKVVENYFGKRHSCEIADLVTTGVEAVFEDPVRPADDAPKGDWEIYKMELSFKRAQKEAYRQDKAKAFLIIMGQCTIAMTNKLESLAEYADLKKNKDVAGLLRTIKELVYSTDKSQYEYMAMQAKMRNIHNIRMKEGENLPNYLKRFLEQQQATEALWGELIPMKLKGKATAVQDKGKNQYLACLFLAGVDRARFKQTLDDLHNDFQLGKVSYPEDVPSMMNYLSNRRGAGGGSNRVVDALQDAAPMGAAFAQVQWGNNGNNQGNQGNQGRKLRKGKCKTCGGIGHWADQCPSTYESDGDDVSAASSVASKSVKSNVKKLAKTNRPLHWGM